MYTLQRVPARSLHDGAPDSGLAGVTSAGGDPADWRCFFDLCTHHVPGMRADGSLFCATCHPPFLQWLGMSGPALR